MKDLSEVRDEIQGLRQQLRAVQRQLAFLRATATAAVIAVLVLATIRPGLTRPQDSTPTVPDPPRGHQAAVPGSADFLAGTASGSRIQARRTTRLKAPIQVVDASGRVLVNIGAQNTGGGGIQVFDVTGAQVAFLGTAGDGSSGVVAAQRRGSGEQALMFAESAEFGIEADDAAGHPHAILQGTAFGGALSQFAPNGGPRVAFVGASGDPGTPGIVQAQNSAGQGRSLLFIDPVRGGQVATENNIGNRTLQIPPIP